MGMFSNLKRASDVEESQDVLGGSFLLDTDIYSGKIITAYADFFGSGAQFIVLKLNLTKQDGTVQEYTERFTVTNREGSIYYVGQDNKKHALPGYDLVDDLCWLTLGKPLAEVDTQKKVLKLWNKDEGKEVPTEVDCLTDLFGQDVLVAIVKMRRNKQVADQNGKYINSADEQMVNEVRKFFHVDYKATVPELRKAEKSNMDPKDIQPDFYQKWIDKNQGKLIDKYKEVISGSSNTSFSGNTGSSTSQSRVFGKRA
jgi:hypothetical protein